MTIGICTDSNSQIPPELKLRYDVEVVPLTVVIDGQEYLEGIDLDIDEFYDMFSDDRRPMATFSKPSAGQFAAAYEDLVGRGCTQILSIHTAMDDSTVLQSARLAVPSCPVPVRLVDSGTARFAVTCCVWSAADAIADGASLDEAAAVAESLAPAIGNVFILGGLRLLEQDGFRSVRSVMTMQPAGPKVLGRARSPIEAVESMARHALAWGSNLKVAIGNAHRDTWPIAAALGKFLNAAPEVSEVLHFRIGPSAGNSGGPGAVSCVFYPG